MVPEKKNIHTNSEQCVHLENQFAYKLTNKQTLYRTVLSIN